MLSTPYITDLEVESNYTLLLTFENGEQRRFDVKPYLSTTVFAPLQDYDFFRQVRIVYGSLEWPGERDMGSDSVYAESEPVMVDAG